MKLIMTMILSASFIAASAGITAEEGLMKAIGKVDNRQKPLINVTVSRPIAASEYIRELHGDSVAPLSLAMTTSSKRARRLAKFKAKLRQQKQSRRLGLARSKVTKAY